MAARGSYIAAKGSYIAAKGSYMLLLLLLLLLATGCLALPAVMKCAHAMDIHVT